MSGFFSRGREGTLFILLVIVLILSSQALVLLWIKTDSDFILHSSIVLILSLTTVLAFKAIRVEVFNDRLTRILKRSLTPDPTLTAEEVYLNIIRWCQDFLKKYQICLFFYGHKGGRGCERVESRGNQLFTTSINEREIPVLEEISKRFSIEGSIYSVTKKQEVERFKGLFPEKGFKSTHFAPFSTSERPKGLIAFYSEESRMAAIETRRLIFYVAQVARMVVVNNEIYRANKSIEARDREKESARDKERSDMNLLIRDLKDQIKIAQEEINRDEQARLEVLNQLDNTKKRLDEQMVLSSEELLKAYQMLEDKDKEFRKKVIEELAVEKLKHVTIALLDRDLLSELYLQIALRFLKAEEGALYLMDDSSNPVRKSCHWLKGEMIDIKIPELEEIVMGYVRERGEPLLISDLQKDSSALKGRIAGGECNIRTLIATPILYKEKLLGVLYLSGKRDDAVFAENDLETLRHIADQASLSFSLSNNSGGIKGGDFKAVYGEYLSRLLYNRLRVKLPDLESGGVRQRVSILSVGLKEIRIPLDISPARAVSVLNKYLSLIATTIYEYGGTIDRFTGKEVVALFGIPLMDEGDSRRAVSAGIEMLSRFLKQAKKDEDEGLIASLSIGISSGKVLIGNIGIGSRDRITAIGDPVDVSYRLQGIALPGQVLIDEPTYLSVSGEVETQKAGSLTLSKDRASQLYAVLKLRK